MIFQYIGYLARAGEARFRIEHLRVYADALSTLTPAAEKWRSLVTVSPSRRGGVTITTGNVVVQPQAAELVHLVEFAVATREALGQFTDDVGQPMQLLLSTQVVVRPTGVPDLLVSDQHSGEQGRLVALAGHRLMAKSSEWRRGLIAPSSRRRSVKARR